jgi:hypothetical protein
MKYPSQEGIVKAEIEPSTFRIQARRLLLYQSHRWFDISVDINSSMILQAAFSVS